MDGLILEFLNLEVLVSYNQRTLQSLPIHIHQYIFPLHISMLRKYVYVAL